MIIIMSENILSSTVINLLDEFYDIPLGGALVNPEKIIFISKDISFTRKAFKHFVDARKKGFMSKEVMLLLLNKMEEVVRFSEVNIPNPAENRKYLRSRLLGRYYEDIKKAVIVILDDKSVSRGNIVTVHFKKKKHFEKLLKIHSK